MEKYIDLISKTPLFEGIPQNKIIPVLTCIGGRVATYEKDEAIFSEGEPVKQAGIILSGEAQIRKEDYHGNRSLIQTLPTGQMFGEALCCIEADTVPVGIYAAENCKILLFDCKGIMCDCVKNFEYQSQLLKNLLFIIAHKNLTLRAKINLLSKRTTREKIMAYLLSESKKIGSKEFCIPFDRQQLADYLGVERSAMSTEIGKLCREGIIHTNKNHFCIIKEE